jgi:hypothetical protein
MSIVSSIEPEGLATWKQEAQKIMNEHPGVFNTESNVDGNVVSVAGKLTKETHGGNVFVTAPPQKDTGDPDAEWDGEKPVKGGVEAGSYMKYDEGGVRVNLPEEPILTAAQ